MSVASCRIIFLLSDVVFSRVCCLVSFRILLRGLNSDLWLCVPRGFDPRCGPAQPSPARPGSAHLGPRAPGACALPMRAPSPLVFSPHSILPSNNLLLSHLSLSPWRPRFWRRWSPEFGSPRWAPLPSLLLSLPLSLPPLPCARPLLIPCVRAPLQPLARGSLAPPARPSWPRRRAPSRAAPLLPGTASRPALARGSLAPGATSQPRWAAFAFGSVDSRRGLRGLAPPVQPTCSRVCSPTRAVIDSWF
jgi:hypothetical protein